VRTHKPLKRSKNEPKRKEREKIGRGRWTLVTTREITDSKGAKDGGGRGGRNGDAPMRLNYRKKKERIIERTMSKS